MPIKIVPVKVHELESQLHEFEVEFGIPSARFVESYANGELAKDDDRFLTWIMTYDAWRLATANDHR